MDGLVSTGNKFPDTILYIISINQKIFLNYFINIFNLVVDKEGAKKQISKTRIIFFNFSIS